MRQDAPAETLIILVASIVAICLSNDMKKICLAITFVSFFMSALAFAGPPYVTDDPEPVPYRHMELYLASQTMHKNGSWTGTAPHAEINYGAAPNLQLHLIMSHAYSKAGDENTQFGFGDMELGAKYRFIQETNLRPMIGVFPLVEVPSGNSDKGLGNGNAQIFFPLWLQKKIGRWSSYGGGGYWVNAGVAHKNFWFTGWQLQYMLFPNLAFGSEMYYRTKPDTDSENQLNFNTGLVLDITDNHHLMLTAGRGIKGPILFSGYIAYQLTFGI